MRVSLRQRCSQMSSRAAFVFVTRSKGPWIEWIDSGLGYVYQGKGALKGKRGRGTLSLSFLFSFSVSVDLITHEGAITCFLSF